MTVIMMLTDQSTVHLFFGVFFLQNSIIVDSIIVGSELLCSLKEQKNGRHCYARITFSHKYIIRLGIFLPINTSV